MRDRVRRMVDAGHAETGATVIGKGLMEIAGGGVTLVLPPKQIQTIEIV